MLAASAVTCDAGVNVDSDGGTDRYGKLKLTTTYKHYTVSQKNRARIIMPHNSHKCGPMLIILSLSHSETGTVKELSTLVHICESYEA